MIPLIWRHLFFKQLISWLFVVASSLLLLLLLRIDELAKLAAVGISSHDLLFFAVMLLVQLLPVLLLIAQFISTYQLWTHLAHSGELLGALTSGITPYHLLVPSLYLGLIGGLCASGLSLEIVPYTIAESKKIKTYWNQINPSQLLHGQKLWQLASATVMTHKDASDLSVLLVSHAKLHGRTTIAYVDKLEFQPGQGLHTGPMTAVTFYTPGYSKYVHIESSVESSYSALMSPFQEDEAEDLLSLPEHMPLNLLSSHIKSDDRKKSLETSGELLRRLCFLWLPLPITLLAIIPALRTDTRKPPKTSWIKVATCLLLLLLTYVIAKNGSSLWLSTISYGLIPLGTYSWALRQFKKGV